MSWARFDDHYPMHRKMRKASDAAFRLDVSGICWSAEHGTDGFVGTDDLSIVSDVKRPLKAVEELVARERWEVVAGGWLIHDFLIYNPTAEHVREVREKRAEAGRLGGLRSGQSRSNSEANAEAFCSAESNPVPSRPVPTRPQNQNPGFGMRSSRNVPDDPDLIPAHTYDRCPDRRNHDRHRVRAVS